MMQRVKVISLGDSLTGKSCLIKRFCEGKFVHKYVPTIGIDYGVKTVRVDGQDLRVNFFDFSGLDCYLDIRNEFYKDSQGVLLVFDVTDEASFKRLGRWLAEAEKYNRGNQMAFVVAGNKSDAPQRAVPIEEAQAWATSHGLQYFEVSAQSGANVSELFTALFAATYQGAELQRQQANAAAVVSVPVR